MPEPAATAATARLDRMGFAARPRFPSPRHQAMAHFLAANGWNGAAPVPLAADASFRAYFRLRRGDDSAVVMDAPPPQEDVGPYVAVAAILRRLGLSAPEVLAEDRAKGFLLIEDFGDDTYTRLLQRGADEPALYTLAIDVLAALQHAAAGAPTPDLPQYDEERRSPKRSCWSIGTCLRCSACRHRSPCARNIWRCGARFCRSHASPFGRPSCCAISMSTI